MPWKSFLINVETDDGPREVSWWAQNPARAIQGVEEKYLPAHGGMVTGYTDWDDIDLPDDDEPGDAPERRMSGGY